MMSAQNVLHEIQCTPRHVSSWIAASAQCDDELPLRYKEVLHTQGLSCVPTGTISEKSGDRGGHAVGPPLPIHPS
jgi:hypothetical protein